LLTRPVRDTLTLMPPLCSTDEQIADAVIALEKATAEVLSA
jgi:adenosylmethionine-8-amino-7-oxononanoate aminotransferase